MLEKIGKDGCNPAAGADTAGGEPSGNDVDLIQQLSISKLPVGKVIHQREMVRRALAGNPNKLRSGLHDAELT